MAAPLPETHSHRERQRAEREVLILNEAERVLSEHGYHELIMEQLADRVGIAKGTIYLHFHGRRIWRPPLSNVGWRALANS